MYKTAKISASFLSSVALITMLIASCSTIKAQEENGTQDGSKMEEYISSPAFPVIQLPKGYIIEKVVDELS